MYRTLQSSEIYDDVDEDVCGKDESCVVKCSIDKQKNNNDVVNLLSAFCSLHRRRFIFHLKRRIFY